MNQMMLSVKALHLLFWPLCHFESLFLLEIRRCENLSLILDQDRDVGFLVKIKSLLENPSKIVLGI